MLKVDGPDEFEDAEWLRTRAWKPHTYFHGLKESSFAGPRGSVSRGNERV